MAICKSDINLQIFSRRNLVFILLLSNCQEMGGENITLEGYYGTIPPKIYVVTEVYSMSKNVVEHVCAEKSFNYMPYYSKGNQMQFVNEVLVKEYKWTSPIWVFLVNVNREVESNSPWMKSDTCKELNKVNILDENEDLIRCAIWNVTSSEVSTHIQSSDCLQKNHVLCITKGEKGSSEVVKYYNMTIVPVNNIWLHTLEKDMDRCFNIFSWTSFYVVVEYYQLADGRHQCVFGVLINYGDAGKFSLRHDESRNSTIKFRKTDVEYKTTVKIDIQPPLTFTETEMYPCTNQSIERLSTLSEPSQTSTFETPNTPDCCACPGNESNTTEAIQKTLHTIKTDLTLSKKDLTKYKRTKISAPDERLTSVVMGTVAIIFLVSVVMLLLLADLRHIPVIVKYWAHFCKTND